MITRVTLLKCPNCNHYNTVEQLNESTINSFGENITPFDFSDESLECIYVCCNCERDFGGGEFRVSNRYLWFPR